MSANQPTALVIATCDDRLCVLQALSNQNYRAIQSDSVASALQQYDPTIDLVICDLSFWGTGGQELMRRWHLRRSTTPFILMARSDQTAEALLAMKLGAADYVAKPINSDELVVRAAKWREASRQAERLQQLEAELDRDVQPEAANHTLPMAASLPSLQALERAAVERALEQHRGNRTRAAKSLGISVRTLQRKLKIWHAPVYSWQDHASRRGYSMSAAN